MKIHKAALLAVIGASLQNGGGQVVAFSTYLRPNSIARPPATTALSFSRQADVIDSHGSRGGGRRPFSSYVAALHFAKALPSIDITTAPPEQIDALVQEEYQAWCTKYGKTASNSRYPTFKQNYLLQLQYDQQTGVYCGLNEYGDLTPEQYEQVALQPAAFPPVPAKEVTADQVDVKIRSEHARWTQDFNKNTLSEERYQIFKHNFLENMKYYEQTGEYYVLNEYADMTPEEFAEMKSQGGWSEPTAAAAAESTTPSSFGNYMESLAGGSGAAKPPSYMPKSYKQSSGPGMPSYFDNLGASAGSMDYSSSPPLTPEPLTSAGPSSSTSFTSAPPTGAGMASFADRLSGGSGKMKESSYMPKSYKQSPGSGVPSYFDQMGRGGGGGTAAASGYSAPAPSAPAHTPAAGTPPTGAGMASFADRLSGGGSAARMKQSSYMPKSYKQSSGSGMPSYFNQMGSSGDAASSSYAAPAPSTPAPAQPSAVGTPPTGTGMSSFADRMSGGPAKMKQSSYMPKSYKQSSGSGMPSYFDQMGSGGGADSYSAPVSSSPAKFSQAPAASSPPTGAGMASFADRMSGGPAKMKQSSYMPKSYKQSSSSGMPSYFDQMGSGGGGGADSYSAPVSSSPAQFSQPPAASSPATGAGMASFADRMSGGPAKMKQSSYMPKSYKQSSGSGMPSYFDQMGSGGGGAAPAASGQPPAAGTPPTGAGIGSFADRLLGGPAKMKQSSYMPKSYKQSSGSGMPSYFDQMGSDGSAAASYSAPSQVQPPAASAPSDVSYADKLSGGPGKMKQSSFMPKSYKQSSGSGMPSYFNQMGSGGDSTPASYSAPAPTSQPPAAGTPLTGAGMASFADRLSGGPAKMKQSSFMPTSYKQSSGSGMPSYFNQMGSSTGNSYSPPQAQESATGPSAAAAGSDSSGAGMGSFADRLSGGPAKMKQSSFMPKSYKESSGSDMPSYFDNMGGSGGSSSYAPTNAGAPTAPTGAGLPSYADRLSSGPGKMKDSSYMPKSYKQSSGSGMSSYLGNMGSAWGSSAPEAPATPGVGYMEPTKTPPLNIRSNISPSVGLPSDQTAQLARVASPARGAPGSPLARAMNKPHALQCDQTRIMREGESFLPHAMDPVIRRGSLEPDQADSMKYFFTGRLCATEPYKPIPMKTRFPSDQERANNETRRALQYYQQATRVVRRYSKSE